MGLFTLRSAPVRPSHAAPESQPEFLARLETLNATLTDSAERYDESGELPHRAPSCQLQPAA